MKNKTIRYIILFAILAGIAILWYFNRSKEVMVEEELVVPVETIKPMFGTLEKTLTVSGYVKSETVVTVLPKISGTLTSLFVSVGDNVKAGQIIGTIDESPYRLQYDQAKAAFEASKSTFERVESLYKNGATSKQNYEQAKAQYDAYKSQYELAKLQLDYTKIVSPVSGVVLVLHSVAGSLVAPQVPIITVGDFSKLVIEAKVPESYYFFFSENISSIKLYFTYQDLPDKKFEGKIKTITPFISPETKTFTVTCTIINPKQILPGMFLNVNFVLEKKENIYYLPVEVLLDNNYAFYIDEKTHKSIKIKIENGFSNDFYFEIPSQYKDFQFVIEGQHFLKENQKVNIIEEHSIY